MSASSRASAASVTRRLLAEARRHGGVLSLALVSIFVASAATVAPIALAKAAVGVFGLERVEDAEGITALVLDRSRELADLLGRPDLDPRMAALFAMIAIVILLGLVSAAAIWASTYFTRVLAAYVVIALREGLMRKMLVLPIAWFTRRRSGDLLSRFATDVEQTYNGLNVFLVTLVQKPLVIALSTTAIFVLNWRLALVSAAAVGVLVVPVALIGRKVRKHSSRALETLGESADAVHEALLGLRVIKGFAAEAQQAQAFAKLNQRWLKRVRAFSRARATGAGLLEIVYAGSIGAVLVLGGPLVVRREMGMDPETFIAFLFALSTMYSPIRQVTRAYHNWQGSMAAAERVFHLLDMEEPPPPPGDAVRIGPIREGVVFDRVSFSYRDEDGVSHPVLDDVSFTIPAGQAVALVGPSGAGKSTIADLLMGFLEPDAGEIRVDGRPLTSIHPASLIEQVAIVSQHPFLFNASFRANITFGRNDVDAARLEEAARAAQIHELITALPGGYDAEVGAGGAALSGGQRQRVTIARALLKDASFLLLDEATSSLDTESERAVQAALQTLMKDRTTLVIAHRLSTIIHTDKILVIDRGHIVEEGSHESLLAKDGIYARLYRA